MLRLISLIILTVFLFLANNVALATDGSCQNAQRQGFKVVNNSESLEMKGNKSSEDGQNALEKNDNIEYDTDFDLVQVHKKEPLTETLFNYTKSKVKVKDFQGIKVYFIYQNGDTRYNMGYALGKSIMLNNNDFAKDLKSFLELYREQHEQYKMDDVVLKLSKAMPCWLMEEMQGLSDALCVNNDGINITYRDIVTLNTVVLWTRLPQKPPQAPPAAPTSVTPIKGKDPDKQLLSPLQETSDEASFAAAFGSTAVVGSYPLVLRTYERFHKKFFDMSPAVMVYNLDNISFINNGFEGLLTVISGMNNNGVVVNSVQDINQENIEIIGSTPPSVALRMVIESASNTSECKELLNKVTPSLEQTFLIADQHSQYMHHTSMSEKSSKPDYANVFFDKFFVYNHKILPEKSDDFNKLTEADIFKTPVTKGSLLHILAQNDFFNAYTLKDKDEKKTVFNVLYSPDELKTWVLMPKENMAKPDKEYIEVDFKSAKFYKGHNHSIDKANKLENFYDKYLDKDEN